MFLLSFILEIFTHFIPSKRRNLSHPKRGLNTLDPFPVSGQKHRCSQLFFPNRAMTIGGNKIQDRKEGRSQRSAGV